jgi:hypothetical protein
MQQVTLAQAVAQFPQKNVAAISAGRMEQEGAEAAENRDPEKVSGTLCM